MNAMIPVQTGIPVPERHSVPRYPFRTMQVGESFFVPNKSADSFRGRISELGKQGLRFVGRNVVEDGVFGARIWRTE
jgi:hypothetical protein